MKIKKIEIENYKSYALKETINFSNLNIITGVNSSGKSSLIESLLILGQSATRDILNGNLKKLGRFDNLKNNLLSAEESREIIFKYYFEDSEKVIKISEENSVNDGTGMDMSYLSAERVGVLDSYRKNRDLDLFNPRGEGLVSLLFEKWKSKEFIGNNSDLFSAENRIREIFPNLPVYKSDSARQTFMEQTEIKYIDENSRMAELSSIINFWLEEFTGYTVSVEDISSQLLQLKYHKGGSEYEPQHVGTGVTFILFQILALLILPEETMVIIENPEIHLHPSLQSNLMYF